MDDLEFSYEELILEKGNYQGSYIYKDQKNNIFNDQGKILNQSKFETLFDKDTKQQTYNLEEKQGKQEKQGTQATPWRRWSQTPALLCRQSWALLKRSPSSGTLSKRCNT